MSGFRTTGTRNVADVGFTRLDEVTIDHTVGVDLLLTFRIPERFGPLPGVRFVQATGAGMGMPAPVNR